MMQATAHDAQLAIRRDRTAALQAPRLPQRRCGVLWNVVKLHQSDAGRVIDVPQDATSSLERSGGHPDENMIASHRQRIAGLQRDYGLLTRRWRNTLRPTSLARALSLHGNTTTP